MHEQPPPASGVKLADGAAWVLRERCRGVNEGPVRLWLCSRKNGLATQPIVPPPAVPQPAVPPRAVPPCGDDATRRTLLLQAVSTVWRHLLCSQHTSAMQTRKLIVDAWHTLCV